MLYLHGLGHSHPANVIDNDFLASLDIGVDCDWIEERVGIRERRTTMSLEYIRETRNKDTRASAEGSNTSTADMAREAALCAFRRAGLDVKSVKMVIAGGCCPEMLIPAEACRLAAELEIPALAFDVSAACASFAAQVHFISQMRPETLPDFLIILNVEAFTRTVDYSDRKSAVLFGDAATAAILSPRVPSPRRIVASSFNTDPAGHRQITIPAGGHFLQDGHRVQLFAIRKTTEMVEHFLSQKNGTAPTDEYFVGHQANLRVLEAVCGRLNIPEDRHLRNVVSFGNCGAAGAPSVLSQNWDSLGPGAIAINVAMVGSGLSWGGVRIEMGGVNSH